MFIVLDASTILFNFGLYKAKVKCNPGYLLFLFTSGEYILYIF